MHMMRSGRSDPLMTVRDEENDDNIVDNEEQETFVLPAAGPDNNIRYEKRSGLYKIKKCKKNTVVSHSLYPTH